MCSSDLTRRCTSTRVRGTGSGSGPTSSTSTTASAPSSTGYSAAGADSVGAVTDDWNLADPDLARVVYDLSGWSFDHQAELAAQLAEAGVPHEWEGTDLVVPEAFEASADSVIASVEQQFGIETGATGDVEEVGQSMVDAPVHLPLEPGRLVTEYDMSDWEVPEREAVTRVLLRQERPFAWEGEVLIVHADDEDVVDSVLDMVEAAIPDGVFPDGDSDDEARLPFETLTTFFLMGDRLRRDPLDADGLEQLLDALDVADRKSTRLNSSH